MRRWQISINADIKRSCLVNNKKKNYNTNNTLELRDPQLNKVLIHMYAYQ